MSLATMQLWGSRIGAVRWQAERAVADFEYDPAFLSSGIQLAPRTMLLRSGVYSFPGLPSASFQGLPGLLADSLPDRFGNAVLDAWLASQGRLPSSLNPVERLCYLGRRGMGALEFEPQLDSAPAPADQRIEIAALVELADAVLADRSSLSTRLKSGGASRAVQDILRVGTSAGGARAKAVIAWNTETGEVRSGQADRAEGFSHWLIKFDGVQHNRDRELLDPQGFGLVEFAYAKMARAAGIEISECRILSEGGRNHFVTRRFDRAANGDKLHMQTLAAMAHLDFHHPGGASYEQAILEMRALELPAEQVEQFYRRMVFNIVARNQDDHVKNFAFLMDRRGRWSLAPAYDLTFAYNPDGAWTSRHQMRMNGKREGFVRADFPASESAVSLVRGRGLRMLDEVLAVVAEWPRFAAEAGVPDKWAAQIGAQHRCDSLAR
jgi:serine/threonine-protein kinase HipA